MMLDWRRGKCNTYFPRKKLRAFTLIEFAVVAAILGVLGGVLLSRIVFYQEQAELAAVQRTLATLRSALTFKVAHLNMSNRRAELPSLAGDNPMNWLAEPPANYLGEFSDLKSREIPNGNWFFDKFEEKLIYSLNNGKKIESRQPHLLKFKVKLLANGSSSETGAETVVLDQVGD